MTEVTVLVLGTCDTKLQELLFLKDQVQQGSVKAILLDVGRDNVPHEGINISQGKLIEEYGDGQSASGRPRGEVIKLMASCASRAVRDLFEKGEISGIISAGGSGGTSLAAQVMREVLPIGFPKVKSAPICYTFFSISLYSLQSSSIFPLLGGGEIPGSRCEHMCRTRNSTTSFQAGLCPGIAPS